MKYIWKSLKWLGIALAGLIVILLATIFIWLQTFRPDHDLSVRNKGFKEKVKVVRDKWGVPHIEAKNESDAWMTFGYTVASDRLFQMEIQRRLARGELSELVGKAALPVDRYFRTMGLKRHAERFLQDAKHSRPEVIEAMNSFYRGVNLYIDIGEMPLEIRLFDLVWQLFAGKNYKVRHFEMVDSLSFLGYMAYSFAEGIRGDSLKTILMDKLPEKNVNILFPGYSRQFAETIMEAQPWYQSGDLNQAPVETQEQKKEKAEGQTFWQSRAEELMTFLLPTSSLMDSIQMPALSGSNSWVISPSRSANGKAMLANDPHIATSLPGAWYEAHIKFPGYENYGFHLPLIPFAVVGHNSKKAWALTMFENDDVNLYHEEFRDNTRDEVKFKNKWVKTEKTKEFIQVFSTSGFSVEPLETVETPHGPILTDHITGYEGDPVALWWVYQREKNPILDVLYDVGRAEALKDFQDTLAKLAAPGLNFSWADAEGNIGWWDVGKLPVFRKGIDTKQILDGGSGDDEPKGYVPFKDNPQLVNPPSGIIVTANNLSTTELKPGGNELEGYWQPSDRAARLRELLSEKKKYGINDMKRIQTDDFSSHAKYAIAFIVRSFEMRSENAKGLDDFEKQVYDELKAWNQYNDTQSIGATIYHFIWYEILRAMLQDELGDTLLAEYAKIADHSNFMKFALRKKNLEYWDDIGTPQKETQEDIILKAFKKTVKKLVTIYGDDFKSWQWENAHEYELKHPLGVKGGIAGMVFNLGPKGVSGANAVVNNLKAYPWQDKFYIRVNPSKRRIIQFASLDNCYNVLPAGNSGNMMDGHYDDQFEMYTKGQYRQILYFASQYNNDPDGVSDFGP